ncbi:M20/M25/M40 family metallo-hydrolase [Candidatus Bipolaricaulota bacterium]|nr:M20/M25/M40 family metallo-hydrolase [Candidatus Bipolaricaulota bacterium]
MIDPIELARELVRIPSPSGEEGAVAEHLLRVLRTFCEAERGPLGAVVGKLSRGDGPTVMVEGHLDNVPPGDAGAWVHPPFGAEIADGMLYGRGAVDMKGAIAAQIAGAAAAARDFLGTLLLVYVPHEETAEGTVLARVLDGVSRPDLVVLGEPTDLRLGIGHRGRAVLRLEALGRTAHAAMPELGENAIERMVDALPYALAVPLPEDPALGRGSATVVAVGTPTCGPLVPDRCWALVDRRIVRGETPDSVLADYEELGVKTLVEQGELTAYTGEKLTAQYFFPAWWMDPSHPWVERAWTALSQPPLRVWRFSTDGVESCGRRGIPTVGYGPGDEALAHQPDERISTADLAKGAEGYRRLLRGLLTPEARPRPVPEERRGRHRRRR